jgi:hypothetical protein
MAEATARAEFAEAALAQARTPIRAERDRTEELDVEVRRLNEAMLAAKTELAARDRALGEAQDAAEAARERSTADAQAALRKARETWQTEEAQRLLAAREEWEKKDARTANTKEAVAQGLRRDRRATVARKLFWGGALAAALAGGVMLYPRLAPVARDTMLALRASAPSPRGDDAVAAAASGPATGAEKRSFISVPVANVRAGPSISSGIVATLSRDAEVTPLEFRGGWVLVRIAREGGGQSQQGWISRAFLKDAAGS